MFYTNPNSIREIQFPVRIVSMEGDMTNPEALLKEKPIQIGLSEKDYFIVNNAKIQIMCWKVNYKLIKRVI